ncbi:MAG TPA: protoporphyrinogen oxidase [Trueperaceae bacterium]
MIGIGGGPDLRSSADQNADGSADVLVVGGGISGLATAYWLRRMAPHLKVKLLEGEQRPGGKVRTLAEDGYLVDTGPGTLTLGDRAVDELVDALGLADEVINAQGAAKRYLVRRGRLVPLPGGPGAALRTPLVSAPGKVRALLEPLMPRGAQGDESVHDFLARRLGSEVAKTIGEAMVSGIFAGDPREISVSAALPQLTYLERRHGSLLRGMAAMRRAARPVRRVVGLRGGMGTLTSALAAALGGLLVTGTRVLSLAHGGTGYTATTTDGRSVHARELVLATPAYAAAGLLEPLDPELTELLAIPYVPVDVVAIGYRAQDVPRRLDGFGFLAPRGEGVRSLGVINASALSPGSAPEGHVMYRAIAGGALDPGFATLPEQEKVGTVRRDLATTVGVTAEPSFARVIAWPQGIPQYRPGHLERLARIEAAAARLPGLHLAGNAYRGVGVADCLRDAKRLADLLRDSVADGALAR